VFDFPSSPPNGTTVSGPNGAAWQWDGVKWLSTTQGGQTVVVSDTPPANVGAGTLWWDSVSAQLFVRYQDPNSTAWVQANSLNADLSLYATTAYVDTALAPAMHNVGRNKLDNALFNVAQRGPGHWVTVSGVYTLDRWEIFSNTDTLDLSQASLSDTNRSDIGDEAARFCLSNSFTGSAAGYHYLSQSIEGVARLAGKTVIVSFWANAGAAQKIGINISQNFGSGGSPSTGIWALATGASVTTLAGAVFSRFSVTIPLPSIAGKTLGTNGDDSTNLAFWYSSGNSSTNATAGNIGVQSGVVNLWGVQLEIAAPGQTAPSPLEKLDPATNLQRCQRYYEVASACAMGGYVGGAATVYPTTIRWQVPKRATPTVTSTINSNSGGGTLTLGTLTADNANVGYNAPAAGIFNANFTLTASADL
jgi:hypothetical protein